MGEAVLAAVYLDGGFSAAFRVVETHFAGPLEAAFPAGPLVDSKSRCPGLNIHSWIVLPPIGRSSRVWHWRY